MTLKLIQFFRFLAVWSDAVESNPDDDLISRAAPAKIRFPNGLLRSTADSVLNLREHITADTNDLIRQLQQIVNRSAIGKALKNQLENLVTTLNVLRPALQSDLNGLVKELRTPIKNRVNLNETLRQVRETLPYIQNNMGTLNQVVTTLNRLNIKLPGNLLNRTLLDVGNLLPSFLNDVTTLLDNLGVTK